MVRKITILILVFGFSINYTSLISQVIPDSSFNSLIRTENGGWIAGDATFSIYLPDDRTLWLFGDSFIGIANEDSSIAPGAKMIRNCAIIQENNIMFALYAGSFDEPKDFILTHYPDSTWFWPEHGIVENDTLKIIFSEFGKNDGVPGWNFEYLNAWLVYLSYPHLQYIKQEKLPYYEINGVMYGDRVVNYEGYNYIYGRKPVSQEYNIPMPHIARVSEEKITSQWEFYDGNNWVIDPSLSKKISDQPVSQQYGVFKHQDKFVLITQEIWLGNKIYSMVANQPNGPWSNLKMIYETPLPFDDMFTYNAYPHPQFNENNELLVSYNSNGNFFEIFNNVELYRPNFFRIPYDTIHPSFIPSNISPAPDNTNIVLYPNPVMENLFIQMAHHDPEPKMIVIYNSLGEIVLRSNTSQSHISDGLYSIPVSELECGYYIINIGNYHKGFIHK